LPQVRPDEIGQGLADWYQGIGQELTEVTVGDSIEKESMETMILGALLPLTGERSTRGEKTTKLQYILQSEILTIIWTNLGQIGLWIL